MPVTNSTCGTLKPSLNVATTRASYFSANLPICSLRSSGFSLIQLGAPCMYWSVAKIYSCPVHTSVFSNWASTNETEQTAPKSDNITANVGPIRKPTRKRNLEQRSHQHISDQACEWWTPGQTWPCTQTHATKLAIQGDHTVPVTMATSASTKDNGKRSECRL